MRLFHKTLLAVLVPLVIAGCNSSSPTAPQSIEVTPARASVTGGSSVVLTVGAIGGDEITQGLIWTSSAPMTASVDDSGTVTGGYGEGRATITAKAGAETASALVDLVRLCADLAPLHGEPDPSRETQSFDVELVAGTDIQETADILATTYGFSVIDIGRDGFSALLTPTQAAGVGCAQVVAGMTYL